MCPKTYTTGKICGRITISRQDKKNRTYGNGEMSDEKQRYKRKYEENVCRSPEATAENQEPIQDYRSGDCAGMRRESQNVLLSFSRHIRPYSLDADDRDGKRRAER